MTETERMNAGLLYDCSKKEIMGTQTQYVQHMQEYNTLGLGHEKRMEELLKIMFAEVGEGTYIQPPFYANWGGRHVHLGNYVYANFGLTCVDDPHRQKLLARHRRDRSTRRNHWRQHRHRSRQRRNQGHPRK